MTVAAWPKLRLAIRVARLRSPLTIPRPGPQPPVLSSRRPATRRQAAISCRRQTFGTRQTPARRSPQHACASRPAAAARGTEGRGGPLPRRRPLESETRDRPGPMGGLAPACLAGGWPAASCVWSASRAALSNSLSRDVGAFFLLLVPVVGAGAAAVRRASTVPAWRSSAESRVAVLRLGLGQRQLFARPCAWLTYNCLACGMMVCLHGMTVIGIKSSVK